MKKLMLAVVGLLLGHLLVDYMNWFENEHFIGENGCSVTLTIDNFGNVEQETYDQEYCDR